MTTPNSTQVYSKKEIVEMLTTAASRIYTPIEVKLMLDEYASQFSPSNPSIQAQESRTDLLIENVELKERIKEVESVSKEEKNVYRSDGWDAGVKHGVYDAIDCMKSGIKPTWTGSPPADKETYLSSFLPKKSSVTL